MNEPCWYPWEHARPTTLIIFHFFVTDSHRVKQMHCAVDRAVDYYRTEKDAALRRKTLAVWRGGDGEHTWRISKGFSKSSKERTSRHLTADSTTASLLSVLCTIGGGQCGRQSMGQGGAAAGLPSWAARWLRSAPRLAGRPAGGGAGVGLAQEAVHGGDRGGQQVEIHVQPVAVVGRLQLHKARQGRRRHASGQRRRGPSGGGGRRRRAGWARRRGSQEGPAAAAAPAGEQGGAQTGRRTWFGL